MTKNWTLNTMIWKCIETEMNISQNILGFAPAIIFHWFSFNIGSDQWMLSERLHYTLYPVSFAMNRKKER